MMIIHIIIFNFRQFSARIIDQPRHCSVRSWRRVQSPPSCACRPRQRKVEGAVRIKKTRVSKTYCTFDSKNVWSIKRTCKSGWRAQQHSRCSDSHRITQLHSHHRRTRSAPQRTMPSIPRTRPAAGDSVRSWMSLSSPWWSSFSLSSQEPLRCRGCLGIGLSAWWRQRCLDTCPHTEGTNGSLDWPVWEGAVRVTEGRERAVDEGQHPGLAVSRMTYLALSMPIDDVVEPTPIFSFTCRGMNGKVT